METNGRLELTYISTLENKKDRKMKNIQFIYSKITLLLGLVFITVASCERPISDEVEFASYPTTGGIFIDGFVGGLDYFPFGGSFAEAFSVETNEAYKGEASMRFDIPSFGVGYGGATFPSTGPRNLSSYDALTFWARATQGADINEIGFGINGDGSKFQVTKSNLAISTKWTKYIIPIPDPTKLIEHTGMFWYAEGAENSTDEGGYTFWIDELQFEKLGTIAQPQPAILNGEDVIEQSFIGNEIVLANLTQTFNVSGVNQTVTVAPSYFTFASTDNDVARVSELGVVSVVGSGTAIITASIAGTPAKGSLDITSGGGFPLPASPSLPQTDVMSIYSNTYTDAVTSNFTPGFGGSNTVTTEIVNGGNNVLSYTNNNFTGIIFENTVDASTLTHFHVDVFTQSAATSVEFQIRDIGANGLIETNVNNGQPMADDKDFRFTANGFTPGEWKSFDITLGGGITTQKDNLGAIILVNGPDFILDNMYFYKQ